MFHTQKQQRGRGHNIFFLVRKKKLRTRSLKGIGVSEERKAQSKTFSVYAILGSSARKAVDPGPLEVVDSIFVVVPWFFRCWALFLLLLLQQIQCNTVIREREIERSSGAPRWNTVVATTFVVERTAYCAIHGKRRRRQNETRSAIVAAMRYHSTSVDFSWELVLNARTLASYSSSWSVGRTSPGSSRLTNVIVECEDDSRELQDPELMERLDMAGRKVLLVWMIPRPIAEGSLKALSTLCLLGGGGARGGGRRRLLRDGRE